MGHMKELFISMQEGLLMGSRMDKQVRGRIADEDYQQTTEDSDKATNLKDKEDER